MEAAVPAAPLSHLRSLLTNASYVSNKPLDSDMPRDFHRFFHEEARGDTAQPLLTGSQAELRGRLFEKNSGEGEMLIDDVADLTDDEMFALKRSNFPNRRHRFMQQRIFGDRNGREAFMEALQRRYGR